MDLASTRTLQLALMAALKADGGPLETPSLILFTNDVAPGDDVVADSLEEATFTGYAAKTALVFGTPYENEDEELVMVAPSATFIRTGGSVADDIAGWALVNAAKDEVYYVCRFDTPVSLSEVGDGLTVQPIVKARV